MMFRSRWPCSELVKPSRKASPTTCYGKVFVHDTQWLPHPVRSSLLRNTANRTAHTLDKLFHIVHKHIECYIFMLVQVRTSPQFRWTFKWFIDFPRCVSNHLPLDHGGDHKIECPPIVLKETAQSCYTTWGLALFFIIWPYIAIYGFILPYRAIIFNWLTALSNRLIKRTTRLINGRIRLNNGWPPQPSISRVLKANN